MKVVKIKNKESLCKNKYDIFNKKISMNLQIQTIKSRPYNTNPNPHDPQRSWGDWYYYYIYPYFTQEYHYVGYLLLIIILELCISNTPKLEIEWNEWYTSYIYPYLNEDYVAECILTIVVVIVTVVTIALIVIGIDIANIYVTNIQEVLQEYYELFYHYSETVVLVLTSTLLILYIYYKYKCRKKNNSDI